MKIRCKENNIHNFINNDIYLYLKEIIHLDDGILSITVDKEYNVYTVKYNKKGFLEFLICDDNYSFLEYPVFYLSVFFDIIDYKVSKYWENIHDPIFDSNKKYINKIFSFKEWNKSNLFYENLVNCSVKEKNTFIKYKKQIDEEFFNDEYLQQ